MRVCLYYRKFPEVDRWLAGDRFVRPLMRKLIRGQPALSGLDKVFLNLCLGLDHLGVSYLINIPFRELRSGDLIGVLGRGHYSLKGYDQLFPLVAGIGLMAHPSEWPTLCEDYPVARYLQHSEWANNIYRPYFGERCRVWPVGIDTYKYAPSSTTKDLDILLYDKIRWDKSHYDHVLVQPIRDSLARRNLKFAELRYGSYADVEYRGLLARARAMIFLCEHESQGLAYQECLSSDVPILAWDQGWWLDPNRFQWGTPNVPASSVPFFDSRCGEKFRGLDDFEVKLDIFLCHLRQQEFKPRDYVLNNLSLERCSQRFLEILEEAQKSASTSR